MQDSCKTVSFTTFEGGGGSYRRFSPVFNALGGEETILSTWGESNTWGPYHEAQTTFSIGELAYFAIVLESYHDGRDKSTRQCHVFWHNPTRSGMFSSNLEGETNRGVMYPDGDWFAWRDGACPSEGLRCIKRIIKEKLPEFF